MPITTPAVREYTPLHEAVYFEKIDEINSILQEGIVNVNAKTERKETPLHYALCHNKVVCIEPLIKNGANPNKRTIDQLSPLTLGVMQKHYAAVEKLIEVCKANNTQLNFNKGNFVNETPLHFAACHDHLPAVKILVEAGADINVVSKTGSTPLEMAKENGHQEIVDYLTSKGASEQPHTELSKPEIKISLDFIKDGFLKDEIQKVQETKSGGVLWGDCLEAFYSGKKPKIGQGVEIALNFSHPVNEMKYSWVRGIIHTVSEDKQKIIATVKLNVNHEGRIEALAGEWEATLQCSFLSMYPWILTHLDPVTNPAHAYATVFQQAKELEEKNGKKFIIKQKESCCDHDEEHDHDHDHDHDDHDGHEHGDHCDHDHDDHDGHSHSHGHGHSHSHDDGSADICWVLKGMPHSHEGHVARVADGIDLRENGTICIFFEEGEPTIVPPQRAQMLFRMLIQTVLENAEVRQNVSLKLRGQPKTWDDFLAGIINNN